MQTYVGTAKPFDFNGMVRHYYLRDKPWQAEIQIQLVDKGDRDESSHELAVQARKLVNEIVAQYNDTYPSEGKGVRTTVVEMPPGPPVLQTVVAEIYGPDADTRRDVANQLTQIFESTEGMADVDNYLQDSYQVWRFEVDADKAVRIGISVDTINRNLSMALGENRLGDIKRGSVLEPTFIVLEIPLSERSNMNSLGDLPIPMPNGQGTVPLAELGSFVHTRQDEVIYHKDLRPVEYVVGDAVGKLGAPIYPMLKINDALQLSDNKTVDDQHMSGTFTGAPKDTGHSAFEWGGEWTVTYETFRDMGLAFAVALLVIYILVVYEFGNFVVPAIIMAPIPLTMLGIVPGHALLGAEFTATSMIGFIALAGIIVRNSILLVDFAIHQVRAGRTNAEAMVDACRARTRPIIITAFALVAGSGVILSDPIFQGMAISLLFGVLVSSVLTLVVIPLGCITAGRYLCMDCADDAPGGNTEPDGGNSGDRVDEALDAVAAKVSTVAVMAYYSVRAMAIMGWMAMQGMWRNTSQKLSKKDDREAAVATTNQDTADISKAEKASANSAVEVAKKPKSKSKSTAKKSKPATRKKVTAKKAATNKAAPAKVKQTPEKIVQEKVGAETPKVAEKKVQEKAVPVVKKRVAQKKKAKAEASSGPRKRPAVRAKVDNKPIVPAASKKKASRKTAVAAKKVNGKETETRKVEVKKAVVDRPMVTNAIPPVTPPRNKSERRGIRLNPNI